MVTSTAVDLSAVARVLGIKTSFKDLRGGRVVFLPQRIAVIGQGSTASTYSLVKAQVTSALAVAETYGFGSPLHLAVRQLFPVNGDGVGSIPVTVYPLEDDAGGAPSVGDITPGGAQTEDASYFVDVSGIPSQSFTIAAADTVPTIVTAMAAAINAVLEMPVIALDATPGTSTEVGITSKWEGTSANDITLSVVGSTTAGTTFAFTQPTGGAANPDVQDALDQVGNVWESMLLNCMDVADTTSLDTYSAFGEGRWGALVRKPAVVFSGETVTAVASAITVPDARGTDRTNSQLVAPGSSNLPFVVAARQLARIAPVANNNPARDYARQLATGITPGLDSEQWTYPEQDQAVKGGSSTSQSIDGVVTMLDTVTFYHPTGDATPAYRYVNDIVKLQTIIFNLDLIFNNTSWDGAPLVSDDTPTVNPDARKPKDAVAAVAALIDNLAGEAIISAPDVAKASIVADINSSNPKRLDLAFTVQLSGNVNIISVDLNFGFFFGG